MTHDTERAALAQLPEFPVRLTLPDLTPRLVGNVGVPGVWQFEAAAPGPHVVVTAVIHGNEIAGALALTEMLQAGPKPARGVLTLIFANLDALARFDPANPTASRFAEEDMNRLWEPAVLDGPRQSSELDRARVLRPLIEQADVLLDLHSMLWPSDPLILCGPSEKGRALAQAVGSPNLVVADHGHVSGRRLIDFDPFVDPDDPRTAILVEAGQHWQPETVDAMLDAVRGVLAATGLGPAVAPRGIARCAEVTVAVTVASGGFTFTRSFRGGDVIKQRDTLIAVDGTLEIRTPHDDCLLVMPSLRPARGHTAVRLARFI
jgi:predicted deacylase